MKKLIALGIVIALILFFTLPSLIFGDDTNTTEIDQDTADDWEVIDDSRLDGDSFEVEEADPTGSPGDPNEGEDMDVYCLDWIPDGTQGNEIHIGDIYDEANEGTTTDDNHIEYLMGNSNWETDNWDELGLSLSYSDEDEYSEDAIEILSSVATGGTEVEDQLAVWSYTDNFDEDGDANAAAIEDAVSRIVSANRDLDGSNDVVISDLNDIEITLESGPVTLDSSGVDNTGKGITVTMEDPLVPGITDEGKDVILYILGGSVNVSFSNSSLVTVDTSPIMNDVADTVNIGDTDGISESTYYYYWWGAGYDPDDMVAVIGGWVDIDGDGLYDTNNPDMNYVPSIDIVDAADPSNTYGLTTSDVDNTTVEGGTMLNPIELINYEWVYDSGNQRLVVKAYEEPFASAEMSNEVEYPKYDVSFEKIFEGTPSSSAEFDIYAKGDVGGTSLGHDSLSGDGTVDFTNLPPGDYVIVETTTPPGYTTMSNISITIAQDGTVSGLPTSPVENTLEKDGSITVCKFDAATGDPLLGSTFQLQMYVCPTNQIGNAFAVESAAIVSCDWINVGREVTLDKTNCYTWYELLFGDYRVVEVSAPAGYLTVGPIEVTIDRENPVGYVEFYDPRIPSRGSITLNKSGLDSTDVAGFTLYDSSNNPVGSEKTVTGNGTVQWTGLPKDTYKIVETTVPSGYSKMADITGIVVESGNLRYSFDRTNTKTPPGELEVLGIQELPFTGMHPAIPISGITMILGGAAMFIASLKKRFRRK